MAYSQNRVTVRIRSAEPLVWLDVWPESCDVCVYPADSIARLDLRELGLLHAAVGYILEAGAQLTAEGMVKAIGHLSPP